MLELYNTATHRQQGFEPADGKTVRVYSCGPTVYDFPHIGNLRTFVLSDILCRYLAYKGWEVRHVMNITDVDDKTINGALTQGISLSEYTQQYTEYFFEDLETLNIQPAWKYPRATEHIEQMQNLVQQLLDKDHAYERWATATSAAWMMSTTARRPATLCCGRQPGPMNPPGIAPGGPAGPAGISSVRQCQWNIWGRPSTSTPAQWT